jgi:hypothetical protein
VFCGPGNDRVPTEQRAAQYELFFCSDRRDDSSLDSFIRCGPASGFTDGLTVAGLTNAWGISTSGDANLVQLRG